MTATDILNGAAAIGVQLRLDTGRVLAGPKARLTPALCEAIRANLDELREALAANVQDRESERQDACHVDKSGDRVPSDLPAPMWATCGRWEGGEARKLWWWIARILAQRLERGDDRAALEAIEAEAAACVDARELEGLRAIATSNEWGDVNRPYTLG